MTDKVQKILEEVIRMHNLLPVMDGDNISVNYADRICTTLEMYIDSLQEEPVSEEIEVSYEAKINEAHRLGREEGMFLAKTMFKEPISDDLEKASTKYAQDKYMPVQTSQAFKAGAKWQKQKEYTCYEEAFEDGAKWQKEQFKKNRLAACDKQTEEEAEIESNFVICIIEKEHRQPTFDDAIKYGMRLQKEQIKEALLSEVLPYFMHGGEADEVVAKLDEVLNQKK